MSKLSEKLRKSRLFKFEIDGHKLILERPTQYDMVILHTHGMPHRDIAQKFVVGWEEVREVDILKGGTTDIIEFDQDAWCEWLDDNPEWWAPIGEKVVSAFTEYLDRRKTSVKN